MLKALIMLVAVVLAAFRLDTIDSRLSIRDVKEEDIMVFPLLSTTVVLILCELILFTWYCKSLIRVCWSAREMDPTMIAKNAYEKEVIFFTL